MTNIVDVACSSPPITMNATKPTVQTVQAADQDPFGLVLQKASERIDNDKQYESASKSSDSKSTETIPGSESTANKKVKEPKNEREVERSSETEKTNKDVKIQDDTKNLEKETANDSSTIVFGYVTPVIPVADTLEKVDVAIVGTTSEVVTDAVQPANLTQVASTTTTQTEEGISATPVNADTASSVTTNKTDITTGQTVVDAKTEAGTDEIQDSKVETKQTITFSETLSKGAKIGEKTTTELDPAIANPNQKMADGGKVDVSTSTNNLGQEVISISRNYQEAAVSTTPVAPAKTEKAAEVNVNLETAPPDTPNGTASASASATVQTASQISEPARLAEAPKNEVITQVANQLDQMVKTSRSSLRLQLYPEELGHIDLRIVTTKDGISVTMVTEKASTQQVLKSDMDILKQNIEQAGIQLTNLNINQGQNSNRQQAFEHRQNFSNGSYPGTGSDNSNSSSNEPKKHLTSSEVDYKV